MNQTFINIALSGDVGTGSTTLGRNLAATLGWEHTNAGAYFRAWHAEHNIPLEDVQDIPESVDRELDMRFKADMALVAERVFESHLAGWLAKDLPQTFKILCVAEKDIAMQRIAARESLDLAKATKQSVLRSGRLSEKFGRLYGVFEPYDPTFFDLTIDTTHLSAGAVLDLTLKNYLASSTDNDALARLLEVH